MAAVGVTPERPILIDRFLSNAVEAEADAISDGKDVFVPTVMQHIELAGIHSGDSACVIPPVSIAPEHVATIIEYTQKIAREMKVVGLMNMQYAIEKDKVYVLEANPRASRTVPLVSKVCNISMAKIATEVIMADYEGNGKSPVSGLVHKNIPHFGVKEAVFPFNMFPEVDPVLGPEMRSTGEVLGIADSFGMAFWKAQEATQIQLPTSGTVLMSINDSDKPASLEVAKKFIELGFNIKATTGTHDYLKKNGIVTEEINKLSEARPNILDAIKNKEISLVINTPSSKRSQTDASEIRKSAIRMKVPRVTTITSALACTEGIAAYNKADSKTNVKSIQEYHADIK
jgi:carbamoyl-phosphate synthase large subunit